MAVYIDSFPKVLEPLTLQCLAATGDIGNCVLNVKATGEDNEVKDAEACLPRGRNAYQVKSSHPSKLGRSNEQPSPGSLVSRFGFYIQRLIHQLAGRIVPTQIGK